MGTMVFLSFTSARGVLNHSFPFLENAPKKMKLSDEDPDVVDGVFILTREKRFKKPYQEPAALTETLEEILRRASENSVGDGSQLAAALKVLYTLKLSQDDRELVHNHINASFSRVTFKAVAPFYSGLNSGALIEDHAGFSPCQLQPFRLSRSLVTQIVHDIDVKFVEYGRPAAHLNETARNHCLGAIFSRIVSVFDGIFSNKSEQLIRTDISAKRGQIEHLWVACESICVNFVEVKLNDPQDALVVDAQIILEADACAYWNSERRHCIPIIGINARGSTFKVLVYHPHTRKFFLTEDIPGLSKAKDDKVLLSSIKKVSEIFFSAMLSAYINAFEAFLMESEEKAKVEGTRRVSTPQWEHALKLAKQALVLGHKASMKIKDTNVEVNLRIQEAEQMAEKALDLVRESVSKAPSRNDGTPLPQCLDQNWDKICISEAHELS
ncbi:hypothetical protein M422DRAFT_41211 [Sphaerobolus stellatus SS14]|nr:hypothetical protein M422DRAFT_41211 [Sphaerobolus stellatus SS14]